MQSLFEKLKKMKGNIGFYYAGLDETVTLTFNPDMPVIAASVIKIPIMIEAFRRFEDGNLDPNAIYTVKKEDHMPSCGALNRMHVGLEVTIRDLVELMIILSDNSATNILIDMLGPELVTETIRGYGAKHSVLRRRLFNTELWRKGINNHITAGDMGVLLEKMYRGEIVSPEASAEMIGILKEQRLNSKIPFFLEPKEIITAHKTGEDDNTTHDVGIVYAKKPFVLCMVSNETDVPKFERLIQDIALELAERNGI